MTMPCAGRCRRAGVSMAARRCVRRCLSASAAVACWIAATVAPHDLAAQADADEEYVGPLVNQALESEKSRLEIPWHNPATGSSGMIMIERTFYRDPRTPCRDYRRTLERAGAPTVEVHGTGCRIGAGPLVARRGGSQIGRGHARRARGPARRRTPPPAEPPDVEPAGRARPGQLSGAERSAGAVHQAARGGRLYHADQDQALSDAMATTSSAIDRAGGSDAMRPSGALLARRYRLEARQRGAADRFEAIDRTTGERVFVKFGARGERLAREAELLARARPPGHRSLQGCRHVTGRPFIVLEWVDGSDLEAVLAGSDGRLADDQLIRLLGRLAAAVAAIHGAGWLHRDLKPANILVRPDGTPVIVDFGAAAPIQEAGAAPDSEITDGYAAPEQYLTDGAEGPWTDLYGLGAIAYRALCGRPPVPAPARLRGETMPLAMESAGRHAEALCRATDWALALDGQGAPADRRGLERRAWRRERGARLGRARGSRAVAARGLSADGARAARAAHQGRVGHRRPAARAGITVQARARAWRWRRRCCWRSPPGSPAPPGTAGRCTSATSRPIGSSIPAAAATRCRSRMPWRAPASAPRSRSAPAPMTRA